MARRVVYQCDRCERTAEQADLPSMWVEADIRRGPKDSYAPAVPSKMWCDGCWDQIRQTLPRCVPVEK